ncbi:MAG: hypothetical protein IPN70_02585 [Candidatus Moraniibacteriota bacterium]|nr:MAG: hypothetical protein IPN70_02585 [Candidatus Moranbacteria bacterium]
MTEAECEAKSGAGPNEKAYCSSTMCSTGEGKETYLGECDSLISPHCCKKGDYTTTTSCAALGGTCSGHASCPSLTSRVGLCDKLADGGTDTCCKPTKIVYPDGSTPKANSTSSFDYTPLEPIPGATNDTSTLAGFLEGLYFFVMWSAGVMAMFMIGLGGFWYLTSAGNTSRVGEAKTIIVNALLGLLVLTFTWLILYIINPDLTKLDWSSLEEILIDRKGSSFNNPPQIGPGNPNNGNGSCSPVSNGPCSVENLKQTCLSSNVNVFSQICNKESSGDPLKPSVVDRCKKRGNNEPFSIGLYQINLTVHTIGGLNCPSAFNGKNYDCIVINKDLYEKCVKAAQDPNLNIKKACEISGNGNNIGPWKNTAITCGLYK